MVKQKKTVRLYAFKLIFYLFTNLILKRPVSSTYISFKQIINIIYYVYHLTNIYNDMTTLLYSLTNSTVNDVCAWTIYVFVEIHVMQC